MTPPTRIRAGGWRDAAACVHVDAEIFYPVDERPDSPAVTAAKQVCAACPVRKICLADVMAWEDPARRWGITAGLTPAERAARFNRERATTALAKTGGATRRHRSTVKTGWTPNRTRRIVENDEFTAFSHRILRAAGRRIAAGDVEALPALAGLAVELEAAISDAVAGLRAHGYSWSEIAGRLGITRQAAHQRWATPVPGSAGREVA